jgi:hypothetical protein
VDFNALKKSIHGPKEAPLIAPNDLSEPDSGVPLIEEYEDHPIGSILNQSLAEQSSEGPLKDNMCKIVQDQQSEDAIQGHPGKSIYLSWRIKNESKKQQWPRYPILRNVTKSEKVLKYIPPSKFSPDLLV